MLARLTFLATLFLAAQAVAADPKGPAAIVDGDSLVVAGERVRLHAIDAPELREPLGHRARDELERILGRRAVYCEAHGHDRYGNTVATCRVGTTDIAGEMVRRGWARAWRRYGWEYVGEEAAARAAGRGIWAAGMEEARRSARHPE